LNPFTTPDKLYISKHPQDMRAGIQRLASTVTTDFDLDPIDGALYVFVSRDCEKVKMLRFETNGWCLYYVRLCDGGFKWQHDKDDVNPILKVERRQLLWLLEGLEIIQPNATLPITVSNIL
jgi:transposase